MVEHTHSSIASKHTRKSMQKSMLKSMLQTMQKTMLKHIQFKYPAFSSKTKFCILIINKRFQDNFIFAEEEKMKFYVLNPAINSHQKTPPLDNTKSYLNKTETTNSYFMMRILYMLKSLITMNMTM